MVLGSEISSRSSLPIEQVVEAEDLSFVGRYRYQRLETAHCIQDRPRSGRSIRRARQALVRMLGNEQQLA